MIWADMFYGIFVNLSQKLIIPKKIIPADGLPVAPDIAFNWLQFLVGIGMALLVSFAFWVLLNLNRRVIAGRYTKIGILRTAGLIFALLFSLPAVWEMFWVLMDLVRLKLSVHLDIRYIIVALCLPYPFFLTLKRIRDNHRLRPSGRFEPPLTRSKPA